jgi:hypothetical protein
MKLSAVIAVLALSTTASFAQPPVTSLAIGLYHEDEKAQLVPAFVNSVNDYLHRYEPQLVTREADYAKMRVDYGFLYDVELKINADNYEVRVRLAQKTGNLKKARKQAAHLSSGVYRTMERYFLRSSRMRARG